MRSHATRRVLVLYLLLGAAGCASPPAGDVKLARATLDKAVAAGAENFAAESLKAARQAQAVLDAELKAQDGKWFKSFDKARDLAIEVQAAADKAAAEAATRKAAAVAEAGTANAAAPAGPNLFVNGSFADGLQGWTLHPESDATTSVDAIGSERAWHVTFRKGNWSVIYQEVTLRPDTLYVYEARVKTTAPVVALYWQTETGRYFEIDKTYPDWTHLRYVFLTPHWNGQPYRAGLNPVLMRGPGEAWIKDLRLSESKGPS